MKFVDIVAQGDLVPGILDLGILARDERGEIRNVRNGLIPVKCLRAPLRIVFHVEKLAVADRSPVFVHGDGHFTRRHVVGIVVAWEPGMVLFGLAVGPEKPLLFRITAVGLDKVETLLRRCEAVADGDAQGILQPVRFS